MATDWLCYTDTVQEYIQHRQDYRLMPYLTYTSVAFHMLFASNTPPRIQYPHGMVDVSYLASLLIETFIRYSIWLVFLIHSFESIFYSFKSKHE